MGTIVKIKKILDGNIEFYEVSKVSNNEVLGKILVSRFESILKENLGERKFKKLDIINSQYLINKEQSVIIPTIIPNGDRS